MVNRVLIELIKIYLLRASYCLFVYFLGWTPGLLTAQNFFNSFKIDHWDTKSGLPNDLSLSLYQSKDGYIWLTSYAGLTRFDGINFTTFNSRTVPLIKSDNIELVYEDKDSTLWIPAQSKGLISFKRGVFTEYATETLFSRVIGTTTDNELLFSMGLPTDPFLLFNTKTKTGSLLSDSILAQMFKAGKIFKANDRDQSGNQWRVIRGKLEETQDGQTHILTEKEGIHQKFLFHDPFVDSQDRVWLPTSEGLLLWNGSKMEPYPGMENKAFFVVANTRSGLIMEDKQGGIWAAYSGGLARLGPQAHFFDFFPQNHILQSVNITYLLQDKEGSIWASSENGLFKLSQSKFKNYSEQEGLSNNRVASVCVLDTQQYLVATSRDGRLFYIDHGQVSPFHYKNPHYDSIKDEVFQIYQDYLKNIWICGQRQTIKISGKNEKRIVFNSAVRGVYEDKDKKLWFGLPFRGIGFLNYKDELELANFPEVDFKTLFITSIRKLKNEDWLITTGNKGVVLINPQGKPTLYNDTLRFNSNVVYNSYEELDGSSWVASNKGIFRFKEGRISPVIFKEGLSENALFAYLPDQMGNVWLPSNRGIVRVRKQDLNDFMDKKINTVSWHLFDDGDGMRNRQCTGARYSVISPDGRLLIPTMGGLVEIDPAHLPMNQIPPSVVIQRVLQDDNALDLTRKTMLKPGNHRYLFEFSGLSLIAPEKVKFKFKLIGYDKDWITSIDRRAFYTNLPGRKYIFQVIACNNDGVWNESGDRFEFEVLPFYYETIWFKTLAVVVLIVLIWLVVRWRTWSTRKQNELLEAQVASRTLELNKVNGDLNQTNTAIASQRDNLEQTLRELKTTQTQLIQSEKMASLGEMAAGIAHEIQNPLNFVNNFSEVNGELIKELEEAASIEPRDASNEADIIATIKDNSEKINHHGKRAESIVKGMLQHSRKSTSIKEPTDISVLADEYMRLSYHGLRAKDKSFMQSFPEGMPMAKIDLDPSIPLINVIPQDMGRVFLNLFNNAFWAANERRKNLVGLTGINEKNLRGLSVDESNLAGSSVPYANSNRQGFSPSVTLTTKNFIDYIEIRIRDNGVGIPPNIIDKIFQPFFTTKPTGQGTGLGLSLAYDIIKAHNGTINVRSKENSFTEFIIQLPVDLVKG